MRRKSNRNSAKSTPESKTETRKATRSSRRRKSPSVEPEDCTTSTNVNETITDNSSESPKYVTSISPKENIIQASVMEKSVEDESQIEDEKGGHTPPRIKSTGNEEPKKDEVDADKGKSKGISNSQVEENSEIQMNSVTTSSPDEAIKSEVNPDATISIKENIEISENQNVDKDSESNSYVCINEKVSEDKVLVEKVSEEKTIDEKISEDKVTDNKVQEEKVSNDLHDESSSQDKHKDSSKNSEVKTCEETESDDKSTAKSENVNSESDNKETETEQSNNNIEADDDQTEEGEIRESKSDEENESYSKELQSIKAKKTIKIKLRRDSFFNSIEESNNSSPIKKMKWNPETHGCLKILFQDLYRLTVDDFKALSPDLKLADENEVRLEDTYQPRVIKERVKSMDTSSEEVERPDYSKQISTASSDDQESTNIIALNRKISIVDDSASKLKPPPSPAKQPVSQILFISNLVRPFTLKQLKELLERTGTIKEDGFWTDRIKSMCYVWYDSIEEAEATRNALHGVNWPVGNGKKLIIEYATEEQMEKARNPPTQPTPQPVQTTPPRARTPQKENKEPVHDQRNGERKEDRKRKESERERAKPPSTREWDVGKESTKERNRSRSRDRRRKHSGKRSLTPLEDFIARKQKKLEESVPQKLMDDLFQRTKAMPCIYWQPLSPEEISVKQQQRLTRMEEHKRRLEENSRNRGVGTRDRGSYRRRYD